MQAAVPDNTIMEALAHLALTEVDAAGGGPHGAAAHLERARALARDSEANVLVQDIDRRTRVLMCDIL